MYYFQKRNGKIFQFEEYDTIHKHTIFRLTNSEVEWMMPSRNGKLLFRRWLLISFSVLKDYDYAGANFDKSSVGGEGREEGGKVDEEEKEEKKEK